MPLMLAAFRPAGRTVGWMNCNDVIYRVSIKSFPDYKHLLQENYVEYRLCNCNITINTRHQILETNLINGKKNIFIFHLIFL